MATIKGTSGNDTITPESVSPGVTGGIPSDAADTIYGYAGNDTIDGGGGNDWIDAGSGADTVRGGNGDDTIYLTTDFASVSGGGGYDRVYISGTAGNSLNLTTAGIE